MKAADNVDWAGAVKPLESGLILRHHDVLAWQIALDLPQHGSIPLTALVFDEAGNPAGMAGDKLQELFNQKEKLLAPVEAAKFDEFYKQPDSKEASHSFENLLIEEPPTPLYVEHAPGE